ncbi:MAG: hypothetical protein HKN40_09240 [Winogradskyella sp.]|uniref:M56 family metallopeptidase n=1 Tax=Winogradskyella sp. TaxID=1883156 RepID=UPI0017A7F869|nr:hypothetical protein [Winogradskyella sp.]
MEYLIKASTVICIFYACYKLFLQKETFFQANRWFLLSGIAIAFTLPFVLIPIYIESSPMAINNLLTLKAPNTPAAAQATLNYDFISILIWLYSFGVLFFLGRLCTELTSIRYQLKKHKSITIDGFRLIKTSETIPPFSFFKWIVFNPNMFDATELTSILNHEKVHGRQWHSIDILLVQFTCALLWFNPFIWLYKKELQQNLEFIADDKAKNNSICIKNYQLVLLKSSVPKHTFILANNFYNSQIKKRIIMLQQTKSHKLNHYKFLLTLPLLVLFLMNFNTKEVLLNNDTEKANNPYKGLNINANTAEVVIALITKNSTDAELESMKKKMAKAGLTVKVKGLKRNDKGEIIAIKIDAESDKSSTNYQISSDDEAIKPIKIVFDSDKNSISIGNNEDVNDQNTFIYKSEDKDHKIQKSGSGNNVYVITEEVYSDSSNKEMKTNDSVRKVEKIIIKDGDKAGTTKVIRKSKNVKVISGDDDDELIEIIVDEDHNTNQKVIIKKENKNVWVTDSDNEEEKVIIMDENDKKDSIFISNMDGKNPLIIIDGKVSTKGDLNKLEPEIIETVNILKGKRAIEKHGEKGKDGVVVIKTKKQD